MILCRRLFRKRMNEKGQAFLEYIMLLSITLALWVGLTSVLKQRDFFGKVFGTPWIRLSNEIEFGIPSTAKNVGAGHPSSWTRHSTHAP